MSEENISDNSDCQLIASINPIAHNFVFNRVEGCEAGIISFSDGKMTFQGNADESAEIFLGYLKERYDFEWKELKQKRDALAAENAALARYFSDSAGAVEHWNSWADADDKLASAPETPATDAYLNSVRAEGLEMFGNSNSCPDEFCFAVNDFAAQLRAGKDGE